MQCTINQLPRRKVFQIVEKQLQQDVQGAYKQVQIIPSNQKKSLIIQKKQTREDLVKYMYATCFSPVPETWYKNNNFLSLTALINCWLAATYH